jgi:hypothetical protein
VAEKEKKERKKERKKKKKNDDKVTKPHIVENNENRI